MSDPDGLKTMSRLDDMTSVELREWCNSDRDSAPTIAKLRAAVQEACDLLAERKYGNDARSPGHNARLVLEAALGLVSDPDQSTGGENQ